MFLVRVDVRFIFGIYIGIGCWRKVISAFDVVCGSFTPLFCCVVDRSLGMINCDVDRSLRFDVVLLLGHALHVFVTYTLAFFGNPREMGGTGGPPQKIEKD